MAKIRILIVLLSFIPYSVSQIRYCAPELCDQKKHVACENPNQAFSSNCGDNRQLMDIKKFKALIIYNHNLYRHQLASGSLKRFKSAAKMATMLWDDELAYLASLNAKTCEMKHDECRNTWIYKYSGQNLARRYSKPNIYSPRDVIVSSIDSWFEEYKDTTMQDMLNYQSPSRMIGHFTTMMLDKNNRCGCAMVRRERSGGMEYFFACNYASINVIGKPIYTPGPPASKCVSGTNSLFSSLCNINEPIDVNRWF